MEENYKIVDIYVYDPVTKEFLGKDVSDRNPLEPESPIIPACSTTIEPHFEEKDGFAIVWVGNKWKQVEDHRGETWYNTETNTIEVIISLGSIPEKYVSTDSVRANSPEGDYWDYDSDSNKWVPNVTRYKKYLLESRLDTDWEKKLNKEFNFNDYYYLPSWRTLYLEIYTTLRDGIKNSYRIRDNHGQYQTVNLKQMKTILSCMADVVDELYLDKQDLLEKVSKQKDYYKIKELYNNWLLK